MTTNPLPASNGWLDCSSIQARGIVTSRTTLHRYLHRSADQNPFPRPMRHTETGRRYWRELDVTAWQRREEERKSISPETAPLILDDDPRAWMPQGFRTRAVITEAPAK
jgi:hypothetical protein